MAQPETARSSTPIPCAVLMCHAPIVIPAIGGTRGRLCQGTTQAMQQAARRLVEHAPDVIVIVSPHTPRMRTAFGVVAAAELDGDFGRFGVPAVRVELPGAPDAARAVVRAANALGIECWQPDGHELDHGALVPLYFVREAGWTGPTLLLSLPYPGGGREARMGQAVRAAATASGQRWALLASGDMSHRLTPDAPAGYDPRAREFDHRFREAVAAGDLRGACAIDPGLRELAAEDAVDSCAVAAGAVGYDSAGHHMFHYEGPFGVGYMEAVLYEEPGSGRSDATQAETPPRRLLQIARDAIGAHLAGRSYAPPPLEPPWDRSRGVFVTLRSPDGALRGCIGHMEPIHTNLAEEVASCAAAAATRDTRFAPLSRAELDDVRLELSFLTPPEPVHDLTKLDPRRYGVVVARGSRRGVLLPDIDGVDSVQQQLGIAATKAGLDPRQPLEVHRFEVVKLREAG